MTGNSPIRHFSQLEAWKAGHQLVILVYGITKKFPGRELFGLTNQLRRAGVSLTSNIAEGFSRQTYKDKLQFYSISLGSLTEIENQLLIAKDIGYINGSEYGKIMEQSVIVSKLLHGLIKKTKRYIPNSKF